MITLLVPEISPSDGFCDVQEQQQELGNLVVGYPTGLLGGWVAGRPNSKGLFLDHFCYQELTTFALIRTKCGEFSPNSG